MKYGYADYGQAHLLPLESEIVDGTGFWTGPGHKVFLGRSCCGVHPNKEEAREAYLSHLEECRESLRKRISIATDKLSLL